MNTLPLRVGIQQRVLPGYRVPFFDALALECAGGLDLYAGEPRPKESIALGEAPQHARLARGRNLHLFSGGASCYLQRGLVDWLERCQPQVLVVEANPRNLSLPAAVKWMHRRSLPAIGWGLGAPEPHGRLAWLRTWGRNALLRRFDALISYSAQGAAEYCAAGFPTQRVFVAPNAAAPRPVHPLPSRPAEVDQPPVALFVGRLQARKRIDLLLRACAALPAGLQPRLWLVGDGPARAELEQQASVIYPAAQFFGARYGPELETLFRAADLFVLPGTGGLAVQQAMAFGLPVIVGEADGTQDDLVRPENGWQVSPGDPDSLQQTLAAALADPAGLRRRGEASYRIAAQEVNLECMVEGFIRAVQAVVGGA